MHDIVTSINKTRLLYSQPTLNTYRECFVHSDLNIGLPPRHYTTSLLHLVSCWFFNYREKTVTYIIIILFVIFNIFLFIFK